jgi:hypothetical protein
VSEPGVDALQQLTEPPWFQIGKQSAPAYARRRDWLFRRVESIEFLGRRSVRRRVSIDFEVPAGLPYPATRAEKDARLVPISVFQKWPPLMGFDITGQDGHPASLYMRATNMQLDFGLVLGMSQLVLGMADHATGGLSPDLQRNLALLIRTPEPDESYVEDVVDLLEAELVRALQRELLEERAHGSSAVAGRIAATVDLAAQMAASSVLWVPAAGIPGADRIVKFSYLDQYSRGSEKSWWSRLRVACSWRTRLLSIDLPHAGRFTRYHLDVRAPHGGVEIVEAEAIAFPPAQPLRRLEALERGGSTGPPGSESAPTAHGVARPAGNEHARTADAPAAEAKGEVTALENLPDVYPEVQAADDFVGPRSGRSVMVYGKPTVLATTVNDGVKRDGSAQRVDRRAHVYLGPRSAASHRVLLQLKLAAPRGGFIWDCMFAAWAIAGLLLLAFVNLKGVAHHVEATVVLLSVVPIVLGYVLVRPGEQDLERYHITGVRGMALISGATPILAALGLVVTARTDSSSSSLPDLSSVKPVWAALLALSGLAAFGLTLSWGLAAAPAEDVKTSADGSRAGETANAPRLFIGPVGDVPPTHGGRGAAVTEALGGTGASETPPTHRLTLEEAMEHVLSASDKRWMRVKALTRAINAAQLYRNPDGTEATRIQIRARANAYPARFRADWSKVCRADHGHGNGRRPS